VVFERIRLSVDRLREEATVRSSRLMIWSLVERAGQVLHADRQSYRRQMGSPRPQCF
jgi:hypothetical protein